MANKIQLKRGLKSKLPTLSSGEPAYTTDSHELYIGTGSGNVNMGGSQWYTGTAMSGNSTATGAYYYSACPNVKVGDLYLNTSYGYVYQCTTAGSGTNARWTYKCSIKGANGSNATVTVDSALSSSSTNPVQNKVVNSEISQLSSDIAEINHDLWQVNNSGYIGLSEIALGAYNGESATKYSTSPEQVGTWINGKPIYRVVWQLNSATVRNHATWYTETVEDLSDGCPVPHTAQIINERYIFISGSSGMAWGNVICDRFTLYNLLNGVSGFDSSYKTSNATIYAVFEYYIR